jgi:hypothetical protein
VPLAKLSDPPETIVSRCRARIDREASPPDRDDLLAAAQFLLPLRYDKGEPLLAQLQELLGGRETMIHSPLYQEVVEEAKREDRQEVLLNILEDRFGPESKDLEPLVKAVAFDRLMELIRFAGTCRGLASFRKRLLSS